MYFWSKQVPLPCLLSNQLCISLAKIATIIATSVDAEPDPPLGVSSPLPQKRHISNWGSSGARDDPHGRGEAAVGPSPTRVDVAEHA